MLTTRLRPSQAGRDDLAALDASLDFERFEPARLLDAIAGYPKPRAPGQLAVETPQTWPFKGRAMLATAEGLTCQLEVTAGVVSVAVRNLVRGERSEQSTRDRRRRDVDVLVASGRTSWPEARARVITEWSRKSRARMVRGFGERDWTIALDHEAPLGMVTLTYPGDWLAVAPTGHDAKRHLWALRRRLGRATGRRIFGAWKLEFQRPRAAGASAGQEAPHFHVLMPCPALVQGERFETWLSRTWAEIVGAEGDERIRHELAGTGVDFAAAARMTDPKRLAVYFLKHGTKSGDSKEYQHNVPDAWADEGCGRFWGFWGLPRAVQAVELDLGDFITARRVLRRVAHARAWRIAHDREYHNALREGWSIEVARARANRVVIPRRRLLGAGGQLTGGWLIVNDGPRLAVDVGRALALRRSLF